jgi:aspartyl-tRNA(Asn)/glutamyl-tRNA(Gln) amidotransferase subunit B
MANAGVLDLVAATVAVGAPADDARKWWLSYLAEQANTRGVEPDELPIQPVQLARVIELVAQGRLTHPLARQVVDGVLAGEGEPDQVVAARGLAVVGDDDALGRLADQVIAANPEVAEKVRAGKLPAVQALVGAVMKQTRGKADAARTRALLLERLGVTE